MNSNDADGNIQAQRIHRDSTLQDEWFNTAGYEASFHLIFMPFSSLTVLFFIDLEWRRIKPKVYRA